MNDKLWLTKDANADGDREELIKSSKSPDVVKAVLKELDAADDRHKKNFEALQGEYIDLKHLIETNKSDVDPLIKEHIEKISEAMTTRQTAMDVEIDEGHKKMVDRMDALETAFKRPGGAGGDMPDADVRKEALAFHVGLLSMSEDGAKYDRVRNMELNIDDYKAYTKVFETHMRRKGEERALNAEEFKALSVGSDPSGGYTVTPAMGSRIITRVFEFDPMRQLCAVESISTGAIEWLVDWGQAGYGWEGETETGAQTSTPDFRKKRIPVHVQYAKPRATQVLLEDSGINIENWLANHVSTRFARGEAEAFIQGQGVDRPRGILTYPDVTTAGTPEYGKIERVNMGAAAAITADGLKDVKYSLTEFYLNRGTWIMNRLTVSEVMKLKDGEGRYLWQPGLQAGQPSMLLGLPLRMSTTMPEVAANALSVCLADWSEFYMIVDRLGITIQRDPFTAKPFIEFYTRKRIGGDVVNFEAGRIGVVAAG